MKLDSSISAIITGGASGLGLAAAEAIASTGAKVTIFDINEDKGLEIATRLGGLFCRVDINNEASVLAGFETSRAKHGQERALIHCAMSSRRGKTLAFDKTAGKLKRLSTEDYEAGVQGILVASYRLASLSAEGMASLPALEDEERGSIVLTASVAAQDGQIGQVIYASAKAGVNGLVLPMARDLSDLGIRVNAIMPGIFATPLMLGTSPQVLQSLSASVPFPKRLGKPEEFGSLALQLLTNTYFNGQCIRLDGAIRMAPR